MNLTFKNTIYKSIGFAIAAAFASSTWATQKIKIVAIDGYPAKAMWVQQFSKFFIPEVNKRLAETGNYKLIWQQSYGGTIVKPKGVLEGIKLGLGDIGIVTTVFHTSKLPSQSLAATTPMISSDARVVAKAIDEIAKEFPTMQAEFNKQNQMYLATGVVLDSYQLFSKQKITTANDLSGKKVAGAGTNLRYLEGIDNVAGVRGGLTNFYNMLNTGLVDGALLWPEAAQKFKISEVAPYMLDVNFGAVNTKTITINKQYWNKLPEEVQKVLQEVAVLYRDHVASIAMDKAKASRIAYIKSGGEIVSISDANRKAWVNSMPNISQELADTLNRAGQPGTKMINTYMNKLLQSGATPMRDWMVK